ncbi:unnamed protein product, partial [Iphiclides podalirius]
MFGVSVETGQFARTPRHDARGRAPQCSSAPTSRRGSRLQNILMVIRIDKCRYGASSMSQGGSRRPFPRGGPRWHPRYKEYWDYEQNYRDVLARPSRHGDLRLRSPRAT